MGGPKAPSAPPPRSQPRGDGRDGDDDDNKGKGGRGDSARSRERADERAVTCVEMAWSYQKDDEGVCSCRRLDVWC